MSKKVYITRPIPAVGMDMLRSKGYEVEVNGSEIGPDEKSLMKSLSAKPYDAVLSTWPDPITAAVFDAVPTAKIFANYTIGYDNIDLAAAKAKGVTVTNAPGNYSDCIAEHTVALILAMTTRLVEGDRYTRAGKYKSWMPMNFIGTDLMGKTIGIVGTGRIGERVAKHLRQGFDCIIIYYDVVRNERIEKEYQAEFVPKVEDVLKRADIVTLHVPLLDSTRHLINAERLAMMKPTAFLVNTARGPVVDEVALVHALQKGIIKGAALDVYEHEPDLAPGLADLPNVILTPHIASARESARNQMATVAAQNIIDFLEGKVPPNVVSK